MRTPLLFRIFLLIITTAVFPLSSASANTDIVKFTEWLNAFRQEAADEGISAPTLDAALKGIIPNPRVVELDRKQPESTRTFQEYLKLVVNQRRIKKGRRMFRENRELLTTIGTRYGVQPRFIVALWGIETDFGGNTGNFSVIEALATLAYDGRRSAFFRKELLNALKIIDGGHIAATKMQGSWAGAMGQTQFMPSSFLQYAVDYDNDGRQDIWGTRADIFASIANYLSQNEWDYDTTWGRKVRLPEGFDRAFVDKEKERPLSEWQRLGIRRIDGRDLPTRDVEASLVMPGGKDGEAFLIYANYKRLLKWNRSYYFATAVGILSDAVK